MALLHIDGVSHYANNDLAKKWSSSWPPGFPNAQFPVDGTAPRRSGSKHIRMGVSGVWVDKAFAGAQTIIVGFALKQTLHQAFRLYFRDANGAQNTLLTNTDGSMSITRGIESGTVLGTSVAGLLLTDAWQYIEVKIYIHASAGTIAIHLNGVNVLTVSSLNTQGSSSLEITNIRFHCQTGSGYVFVTDIYIASGTGGTVTNFVGDCRVDLLLPSGAGGLTEWTPSIGVNYQCIDDSGDINDDLDYVASEDVGARDCYTFDDLSALGIIIHGVAVTIASRKVVEGTRAITPFARIGSTAYDGAEQYQGTTYACYQHIWEQNPAITAAWTEATVNAAQFGMKISV